MRHILALILLFAARDAVIAAEHNALRKAIASISREELRHYANTLADDTFEGREAGSPGGRAAGIYLVKALQRLSFEGGGYRGAYFQSFDNGYRNVLAVIPGSDVELHREVLVIGAHYDHIGYGTHGSSNGPIGFIHNGADDNASGTAALLEISEAFKTLEEPPRRTVLFAFWDGEEKGLLGSKYWVRHPTVALDRVVMSINLDMIGRLTDDGVQVSGSRSSYGLRQWLCRLNRSTDLALFFPWKIDDDSDHWSFFENNIPTLMFHTGLHEDYHRPSDDAHRLNMEGMHQVTELVFRSVHNLANESERFQFRRQSHNETLSRRRRFEATLPQPPPRLGVNWKFDDNNGAGLLLTRVLAGKPAHRDGLRIGDRLIALDGRPIASGKQFRDDIRAALQEVSLQVERPEEDTPLDITIRLDGTPTRLGISWRSNTAEPSAVTLIRVLSGSPADRAGLEALDRVYEIAGRRFADSDEFLNLAKTLALPFTMLIDRDGQLREVTLEKNQ